jgi:two-component system, OmpR family, response regulator RpaA
MTAVTHNRRPGQGGYFTTGDLAKLCHVAPRTATAWCDKGLLPHYRIPGSRDRRISVPVALAFLRRSDYPIPPQFAPPPVLCVGCNPVLRDVTATLAHDAFAAGVAVTVGVPAVAVIDVQGVGRSVALDLLARIGALKPTPVMVLTRTEDDGSELAWHAAGAWLVLRHPLPDEMVEEAVRAALAEHQL